MSLKRKEGAVRTKRQEVRTPPFASLNRLEVSVGMKSTREGSSSKTVRVGYRLSD